MNARIKAVLLASLAAAVITPVGWAYTAEPGHGDHAGAQAVPGLGEEVREWLKGGEPDGKTAEQKVDELGRAYEVPFRALIEVVRTATGTRELTEEEILGTIRYFTYETIKDERRRLERERCAMDARCTTTVRYFTYEAFRDDRERLKRERCAMDARCTITVGAPTAEVSCPATTDQGRGPAGTDAGWGRADTHGRDPGGGIHTVHGTAGAGRAACTMILFGALSG